VGYAYYNENNPEAVMWLDQLMYAGYLTEGIIDDRPIQEVRPDDLKGFTHCHFFAGIGGWDYALSLAGWPEDMPVWTGSCPCQPFSTAGRNKGKTDERHLWPYWYSLIQKCKPPIIFGEQVTNAISHGWLDDVQQGLESQGYAFGSAVLPAITGQRGHGRDRVFFVGDSEYNGQPTAAQQRSNKPAISNDAKGTNGTSEPTRASDIRPVANIASLRQQGQGALGESVHTEAGTRGEADKFVDAGSGLWWLQCPDGHARNIEPTIPVLAYGIPKDLAKLCSVGFGNAIVPETAAYFIRATM
jgi:DNA (cytosine-5)-methyltransferase 1